MRFGSRKRVLPDASSLLHRYSEEIMGNIGIRKNDVPATPAARTPQQQSPRAWEWEPARLMRSLLQWDPFQEMAPFRPFEEKWAFAPSFEVKETKDGYVFKADVPGVKENDIEVQMTGNRLTISGKREEEKRDEKDQYFAYECNYGSFTRSFTLPEGIDASRATADLKDGVLVLTVPKTPEAQPKKIEVKSGSTPKS
jgi:HSP20 family protein